MNADTTPANQRSSGGLRRLAIAYLTFFALLILCAIAIVGFGNPRAGDPVARLQISVRQADPRRTHVAVNLVPVPLGQVTPQVPAMIVQPVYAGTALIADPDLIEASDAGPLPRIGSNGRTPLQAYAAPAGDMTLPRIAIVISGLGISAKSTAAALAKLPPQVTLAFAPYAGDVQNWVTRARQQGHEVLLEVPMEPFDFPDSDPGPHTLRSGMAEDANGDRLVWALSRFTGYTGVTNLLGGRLLSDADALEPVLFYLARRGLLFFDNGAATHSMAPAIAARAGIAFAQANATIDTIQTAMEIDRELAQLENEARSHGSAAGAGFSYPVTIDRVTQWAQGLTARGFVLVPASAIVSSKK